MEIALELDDVETEDNNSLVEPPDNALIPKRNTKALVWKYFGFKADENGHPCSIEAPEC